MTQLTEHSDNHETLPVAPRPWLLPRPRLHALLDRAADKRLVLLVADAGFGKTGLLTSWLTGRRACWHTVTPDDQRLGSFVRSLVAALEPSFPDVGVLGHSLESFSEAPDQRALVIASAFGDAMRTAAPGSRTILVIDDAHELGEATAAWRLVEAMAHCLPPEVSLVVASRGDLPFATSRLHAQGDVAELTAADLAFTRDEVDGLVAAERGSPDEALAAAVHSATEGWPVATRLAVEAVHGEGPHDELAVTGALADRGALLDYLASEVIEHAPQYRELLGTVVDLPWFNAALCARLGVGQPDEALHAWARRGLLVERLTAHGRQLALTAVVRMCVLRRMPPPASQRSTNLQAAADWYEREGFHREALRLLGTTTLAPSTRHAEIARILTEKGSWLVSVGEVDLVSASAEILPPRHRSSAIDLVEGEARLVLGDWDRAIICYDRAVSTASDMGAATAWRLAMMHYLRGELDRAVDVCERADTATAAPADHSRLRAWQATIAWVRRDASTCRDLADDALSLARAADDPGALAAAHTVLAMYSAVWGERTAAEMHSSAALRAARRAGDQLQLIRIQVNRASHIADQGRYAESLRALEPALRTAETIGFANFHALATSNRGEVLLAMGRLDEATADLTEAVDRYRALGSSATSYPLGHLADAHRYRGTRSLAVTAYEEAIVLARAAGDHQGLVPALCGLARTLVAAGQVDDAREALATVPGDAIGSGANTARVLTARAMLAVADRNLGGAADLAEQAVGSARSHGDRSCLAEALWLLGICRQDEHLLADATSVWEAVGDPLGQARSRLAGSLLRGDDPGEAAWVLRQAGAFGYVSETELLCSPQTTDSPGAVVVESLGGFRVIRDGRPADAGEWQSRKARDLLKILVGRGGAPVPRDVLMDDLWPGDDGSRVRARLSVALSTVRTILDPHKHHATDYYIHGDARAVRLVVEHLDVDLLAFHTAADVGLALERRGLYSEALSPLRSAAAAYHGDFLPEDAYEPWAVEPRENARITLLLVLRAQARACLATDDLDSAVRVLRRCVHHDPHDEESALHLVELLSRTGLHGEAQRTYRAYAATMHDIGVESAPFPARIA